MEHIQERRWWVHESLEIVDCRRCDPEAALLQQARHVANRLSCNCSSVLHLIVPLLIVLHGPAVMQKTQSVAKIVPRHVSFLCDWSDQAAEHRPTLVHLYNNILTLWQHRLVL